MGVKDFIKLKEIYSPIRISHFDKIIIDASNLFYTVLSRYLGKLKTIFGTYAFGGVKKNIIDQCAYILYHSARDISIYLRNLKEKFSPKSIFLVLDPLQTPSYYINTAKEDINFQWLTEIFGEITEGSTIETKLKYMEQEKRKGKDSTSEIVNALKNRFATLESLKAYKEDSMLYTVIEDLSIRYAKSTLILSQSTNIMKLSEPLISMLGMFSIDKSVVKIIRAVSEADLLIKNLAREDVPTLI